MTNWTGICYYFDSGWCYHPEQKGLTECVGADNCKWYKDRSNG